MPVVNVSMQAGRDTSVKEELVRRINEAVTETLGVPGDRVWIYLDEYDNEHVAIAGKFARPAPSKP